MNEPNAPHSAARTAHDRVRVVTPAGASLRAFANPFRVLAHLWRHRGLTRQLAARDLAARYRGSLLGVLWSILSPLFLLAVYTFVFSIIFRAKWGTEDEGGAIFALTLFAGLIPFNLFSEVVASCPVLVSGNPSYVKRVVFPLEVLPLSKLISVAAHALISLGVLAAGLLLARGRLPLTLALTPLTWMPLVLLALAAGWLLAALGVFVRDTQQAVAVLLPFLFFLSPIVYPADAVPERFRRLIFLNPISHVVEDSRRTAIQGLAPEWGSFLLGLALAAAITLACFLFFMKSKRAFHDVL